MIDLKRIQDFLDESQKWIELEIGILFDIINN